MTTPARAKQHEHDNHHSDSQPETVQPGLDARNQANSGHATADHLPNNATSDRMSNQPSGENTGNTRAAPYNYNAVGSQPHQTTSLAMRHEARPDADVRRQRTQRALGIALAAGVAAAAFWLQRHGSVARYR